VIDSLCNQAKKENIAVAVFYSDFLSQQEQSITNIVGGILRQLVAKGGFQDYLRERFQEAQKEIGDRGLRLPEFMGMLRVAIALPPVFICVDALGECLLKCLSGLLGSLRDIVRESPTTRIFLTGRPHVREDIQRYFIVAVTIHQRRKKIEEMALGDGLNGAYIATLTRPKAQKGYKSVLGMKVLMWVFSPQSYCLVMVFFSWCEVLAFRLLVSVNPPPHLKVGESDSRRSSLL